MKKFYNLGPRWEGKDSTKHHKNVTTHMESKMIRPFQFYSISSVRGRVGFEPKLKKKK